MGATGEVTPHFERLDPGFDSKIDPTAPIEVLASGFDWVEGPTWDRKRDQLYFSDIPKNRIYRWNATEGLGVWRDPGGRGPVADFVMPGTNGLLYVPAKDCLLVCDQNSRTILSYDLCSGRCEPYIEFDPATPFNSPNDLALAPGGSLYFSDPPTGLIEGKYKPDQKNRVNGVYRRWPDGRIELVDGSLTFPNGVALSPDGKTLYVSTSDPTFPRIVRYTTAGAEWQKAEDAWFDMRRFQKDGSQGMPDGMKVATDGTVVIAAPGGVALLDPTGRALGRIVTGQPTGNCCFGENGMTLFITSNTRLLRVRTKMIGDGF